jgi:sec-independent protein translocase protein TatB
MFGIGSGELVIIAIVMLLAVGPNRMPTLIKAVGKGIREFRRASTELRKQSGIDDLLRDDDLAGIRKLQQDVMKEPPPALTTEDRLRERPTEGVDLVDARDRAKQEVERARAAAARAAEAATVAATGAVASIESSSIAASPSAASSVTGASADPDPDDELEDEPAPVARQATLDEEAKS